MTARSRLPIRRRRTATVIAKPQYQVKVPSATPASRTAASATEPRAAAGAAAGKDTVQRAIVSGLIAVAATAVANARRGSTTSWAASRPKRARKPSRMVRSPSATRIAALARPSTSRNAPPDSSRPTPARPSVAYSRSIPATAAAIASPTVTARPPRSTDRTTSSVTGPTCAASRRPTPNPAATSAPVLRLYRPAVRLHRPPGSRSPPARLWTTCHTLGTAAFHTRQGFRATLNTRGLGAGGPWGDKLCGCQDRQPTSGGREALQHSVGVRLDLDRVVARRGVLRRLQPVAGDEQDDAVRFAELALLDRAP